MLTVASLVGFAVRLPSPVERSFHSRHTSALLSATPEASDEPEKSSDAYNAGADAAVSAVSSMPQAKSQGRKEGTVYSATLRTRPLGLVLAENPSGRGALRHRRPRGHHRPTEGVLVASASAAGGSVPGG